MVNGERVARLPPAMVRSAMAVLCFSLLLSAPPTVASDLLASVFVMLLSSSLSVFE
jgi:hypothetical protein